MRTQQVCLSVLGVLAELGCSVMDADAVAREAVAAKTAGLKAVAEEFGSEVLNADGTLNRAKLGEIVFADETKRCRRHFHPACERFLCRDFVEGGIDFHRRGQ